MVETCNAIVTGPCELSNFFVEWMDGRNETNYSEITHDDFLHLHGLIARLATLLARLHGFVVPI